MKRAVNLRLEESIIYTIQQISEELHTTKTDVIERAIAFFSSQHHKPKNNLLPFAGKLKSTEADAMLEAIRQDKDTKEFSLDMR